MARLSATPRLVRSIEDRMTIPRSSMSWTVSSLHEYQSMTRSRFSFVTESRFTRSFSWPGGPCRTTLEPTGRPPWTIASNPGTPVGSRGMESSLQRTSQAATECEVRMGGDRVSERGLEDPLRRGRPESLGADVPEIPMDRRDEFPESVQARLGPVHNLIEDGLSELLMVRREPMFHLDLDRGRPDVPDP